MARWLPRVLTSIRTAVAEGRVYITNKAKEEMSLLDCEDGDVFDVLQALTADDFVERLTSTLTQEWLYVFKPEGLALDLYVKVALRMGCVVISFHEDREPDGEGFDDEEG